MQAATRFVLFVAGAILFLLIEQRSVAADTNSTARPGGFQFDGKISRPVLENYLSRSMCIEHERRFSQAAIDGRRCINRLVDSLG